MTSRAAGLALGWLADEVLGDPRRGHPVAGFGRLATALEQRLWADSRRRGAAHVLVLVGAAVAIGAGLDRATRRTPWAAPVTAAACWSVLGGRTLRREAAAVAALLEAGDLESARRRIRSLVGRDPDRLSEAELARACIESVAENTSDAVVAPLVWGAVGGVGGLLGYRAINTLDAMIGHRSPRYDRFGFAAARLDDLANWVPARLAAALAIGLARVVGGSPTSAVRTVRTDAGRHPSPNAGQVEAAFAGALGLTLGGANAYGGRISDRGTLGSGPPARWQDIARANRLAAYAGAAAMVAAALSDLARARSLGRHPGRLIHSRRRTN